MPTQFDCLQIKITVEEAHLQQKEKNKAGLSVEFDIRGAKGLSVLSLPTCSYRYAGVGIGLSL